MVNWNPCVTPYAQGVGLIAHENAFTKVKVDGRTPVVGVHVEAGFSSIYLEPQTTTLPETNSSHLKIGHPKRKRSYSNHPFSGGSC